jgi:hypothetical protein
MEANNNTKFSKKKTLIFSFLLLIMTILFSLLTLTGYSRELEKVNLFNSRIDEYFKESKTSQNKSIPLSKFCSAAFADSVSIEGSPIMIMLDSAFGEDYNFDIERGCIQVAYDNTISKYNLESFNTALTELKNSNYTIFTYLKNDSRAWFDILYIVIILFVIIIANINTKQSISKYIKTSEIPLLVQNRVHNSKIFYKLLLIGLPTYILAIPFFISKYNLMSSVAVFFSYIPIIIVVILILIFYRKISKFNIDIKKLLENPEILGKEIIEEKTLNLILVKDNTKPLQKNIVLYAFSTTIFLIFWMILSAILLGILISFRIYI